MMTINKIWDFILSLIETYGSKISCWAWDKRWDKRTYVRQVNKETVSEKLQDELEPIINAPMMDKE